MTDRSIHHVMPEPAPEIASAAAWWDEPPAPAETQVTSPEWDGAEPVKRRCRCEGGYYAAGYRTVWVVVHDADCPEAPAEGDSPLKRAGSVRPDRWRD